LITHTRVQLIAAYRTRIFMLRTRRLSTRFNYCLYWLNMTKKMQTHFHVDNINSSSCDE